MQIIICKGFVSFGMMFFLERDVIKCHLSKLIGERKRKISDVARDTGLHRNTITLLYQETATRVDLKTIDALCRYFNVAVGDLFEWREGEETRG